MADRQWQARAVKQGLEKIEPYAEFAAGANPLISATEAYSGESATGKKLSRDEQAMAGIAAIAGPVGKLLGKGRSLLKLGGSKTKEAGTKLGVHVRSIYRSLFKTKPNLKTLDTHALKSMAKRDWTPEQIIEAFKEGKAFKAVDRTTEPWSPATRYEHPTAGKSVVINNETGKVIHLGGENFDY